MWLLTWVGVIERAADVRAFWCWEIIHISLLARTKSEFGVV